MFRAFTDIAELLGKMLPPWALISLVVLVVLAALPFWLKSIRVKQVSGRVRRSVRAEGADREALVEQIFDIAGERPAVLLAVVEQAIRYNQVDLRNRALELLEATGAAAADVAHIRKVKLDPEAKPVPHPLEVAVRVEGLLEQGMFDTAQLRLDEGLSRYPNDPDLRDLVAKIETARAAASSDVSESATPSG